MAISESRKQKRLQEKKKKRKPSGKPALAPGQKVLTYAKHPMHECLVREDLFDFGLGTVIWARRTPHGAIAMSAFIVDVYCLGVKDAFFHVSSEQEYEGTVKPRLTGGHDGQAFRSMDTACARRLIEGAVDYAEGLGFHPHPDYRDAKGLFGDVDSAACPTGFTYGRAGKPFYIRGPNESSLQARRIIDQLEKRCGVGGFDYLVAVD